MRYRGRDQDFEGFLEGLNAAVGTLPPPSLRRPSPPSAQITGLPRSGTTLLYQLFARTGAVGYPSNVMAMFHRVPWVGARIQAQLATADPTISTRSIAGRTPEPLDPHEFGYFWRRVCGHSDNSLRMDLEPSPVETLQRELDLVASVFGMPVVYKNFLALVHGPRMLAELERMHLFVVQRPERDVAASMIQLRRRLGTPDTAPLGVEPAGQIGAPTVEDRVARQVVALARRSEDSGLGHSPGSVLVRYQDLCEAPRDLVSSLLEALGTEIGDPGRLPSRLEPGGGFAGLDREDQERLGRALERAEEETEHSG